jgi:hypothetical protein
MADSTEWLSVRAALRIEPGKIVGYLLSAEHSDGKDKAQFFAAFGFDRTRPEQLAAALLEHASRHPLAGSKETPRGVNYVVEGPLTTPDGRNPRVLVVWHVPTGSARGHLVTAYPS